MPVVKNSRRSRVSPREADLTQELLANIGRALADRGRSDRVPLYFSKLARRLDQALAAVRVDPEPVALAARHFLCAEALADVLEHHARGPNPGRTIGSARLMAAYAQGVAEKLRHFHERPLAERRQIIAAYPEVNLRHVLRGCEQGVLQWESAAGVLEESREYEILLKRLRQAGLPDG
jgi:hypothetical protein